MSAGPTSTPADPTTTPATKASPASLAWWQARGLDLDLLRSIALLAAYAGAYRLVWPRLHHTPESLYAGGGTMLGRALLQPAIVGVLLALLLPAAVFFKKNRWQQLESGPTLRIALTAAGAVLAWTASGYEYNLWLDDAHAFDRVVVVALAVAVAFHPAALAPLVVACVVVIAQNRLPLGAYSWTDKRLLHDGLLLCCVFFALRVPLRLRVRSLVFGGLVLSAAMYFVPGSNKLRMGQHWSDWLLENELSNIAVAAHLNGWLPNVDFVDFVVRFVKPLELPMAFMTLVIELGAILLVVHRRVALLLLVGFSAMHIGIYGVSGILFWKWMTFTLAMAFFLWRGGDEARAVFRPVAAVVGMVLVFFSRTPFAPVSLAWWDAPYSGWHVFEGEGASGKRYQLPRTFFAPQDMVFAQDRFWYVHDGDRQLVTTFGGTYSQPVYRKLRAAKTPAQAQLVVERHGKLQKRDERRAAVLDRYLRRSLVAAQERAGDRRVLPLPFPPIHIQSSALSDAWEGQEPIVRVRVLFREAFFDGAVVHPLGERVLRTVEIPATKAAAAKPTKRTKKPKP